MTPERYQQIDQIFQAALAQEPAKRAAFLDEVCGSDKTLRQEVESLISSDRGGLSFIDEPAFEMAADLFVSDEPELAVGEHVDRYEILSLLGSGGMGEVYLAQDVKLNRKIALKLLPSAFTINEDRLRRFQQEARAASALNHPNIITIHEIGQTNSSHFIATEFVDGETLRQRMKRGPLSLQESLDIAIQVCGALAAAHHASIVHRDIKPENIMLRPDGYVKVLDFGLAKLTEQEGLAADASAVENGDASSGLLMGTLKYMSPEQARGLPVDARSDIFSLGVVLYEMLTSQAPFQGETNSDLIASISKGEPLPLSNYLPNPHDKLQVIISKALNTDRTARYQRIQGLLADLRSLIKELELESKLRESRLHVSSPHTGKNIAAAVTSFQSKGATESVAPIRPASTTGHVVNEIKRHKIGAVIVLGVLLVLITAGYFAYRFTGYPGSATSTWPHNMKVTKITTSGKVSTAALSPDGTNLVYSLHENGKTSLWLKNLATRSDVQIIPPAEVSYDRLAFSGDSNYIYFNRFGAGANKRPLYRMPTYGGTADKLIDDALDAGFSQDNKHVVFVRDEMTQGTSSLVIANSDGSGERIIVTRKLSSSFNNPSWSPDGKVIACFAVDPVGDGRGNFNQVIEVRVSDGVIEPLSKGLWRSPSDLVWLPDGTAIVITAKEHGGKPRQVWLLSYPAGEARQITHDTNDYLGLSVAADSRTLLTVQHEEHGNIWVSAATPDAASTERITLGANNGDGREGVSWMPDGRILFTAVVNQNYDVWIMNSDGSHRKRLTTDPAPDGHPVATADGRYIVFSSQRSGGNAIWRMNTDGGDQRQITKGPSDWLPQCSPNGESVVYADFASGKYVLRKVPIDGGESVSLSTRAMSGAIVSPDKKWIAANYHDEQANPQKWKIALMPYVGGEPLKTFDVGKLQFWTPLRWSEEGRAIAYITTIMETSNIWVLPIMGGPPRQLTEFTSDVIYEFDFSRDGKRLVTARGSDAYDAVMIENIR